MASTAGAGPAQSQESRASSWFSIEVQGPEQLGQHSLPFQELEQEAGLEVEQLELNWN